MASRGEIGWQSEKTLSECMRYMLDNEIATDVCFEVGPPGGVTVNLRAHEYMLISRSPVFEAMFNSGMSECKMTAEKRIRINDIDADIFKLLLTYMYYENLPVTVESAVALMCAADKYMLPKLFKECGKLILKGLDGSNVIRILEQGLVFRYKDLTEECLKVIGLNSKYLITGTEIMSASRQAMEAILEMDNLLCNETEIYNATISWAKQQIRRDRSIDNPTDEEIRRTLGDLLFKLRFPTMKPDEFAKVTQGRNVLTLEEKESIYYVFATKEYDFPQKFPTKSREVDEFWVDRALSVTTGEWIYDTKTVDTIDFKTDQDIVLTGVGLCTGLNGSGYDVDVEVLQSENSCFKKRVSVPYTEDSTTPFKIPMDKRIIVRAGVVHTITTLAHRDVGYYGDPCQPVCTSGSVTVTFPNRSGEFSSKLTTSDIFGQIPRLYFFKLT